MFAKNTWKPIEIGGNLFSGGAQDLIGIEECVDYDIDTIKIKKRQLDNNNYAVSKKNKKKSLKTQSRAHSNDIFSPSKSGNTAEEKIEESALSRVDIERSQFNVESWQTYGLPKQILDALGDLKFNNPTQIQALTLPAAILGRRDILGAAETGSGKTLAFGLPILSGILKIKENQMASKNSLEDNFNADSGSEEEHDFENDIDFGCVKSVNDVELNTRFPPKPLYALILTPTRELAMQVKNHLVDVAKYTGINIAVVVGGMAAVKQERILSKSPEIVVGTPGRLWELIQEGNAHLSQLENIRFFAIDETDRMLEKGHFQELHEILERINLDESKKKLRQNFVFSATLTLVHELPKYLKTKKKLKRSKNIEEMTSVQKLQRIMEILGITNPKIVDITEGKGTAETLTECRITCDITEKDYYLFYFLKKHPGRTLIFCNSIGCVKRLANLLILLECHPLPLHASMQQRQRLRNLERFRDTENSILVATDVAARGLDIPSVEHVIHYQTPRTTESYVHRSGRTARASNEGITILLIEPNELNNYLKLCRTLEKNEDLPIFPVQHNLLQAVKECVNVARELDELQLRVKKVNSEVSWFQKAAEDMDIIVDFVDNFDGETEDARKAQKAANLKRKQLTALLAKPIFPKGFNFRYPTTNAGLVHPFLDDSVQQERAVEVMKTAMEEDLKTKTRRKPLYKPKMNTSSQGLQNKSVKILKHKGSIRKQKTNKKYKRKHN